MKKVLLTIIFSFVAIALPTNAYALTATPTKAAAATTVSPTKSEALQDKLDNQIDELKQKIASRVSELNLVEKRGIIGTVSEVAANKITITDLSGKNRFVDVDEITKFASASAKGSFGISDLTKGTKISVLGLYNKQSQRILARFIDTTVNPTLLKGSVSEVDKKNFQFVLTTEDQKQTKIDVTTTTKVSVYNKDDGLTKLGFSKITVGNRVVVVGYPSKTTPSLIAGSRVIIFPDLPNDPKIVVSEPSPASEAAEPIITATPKTKKVVPTTKP